MTDEEKPGNFSRALEMLKHGAAIRRKSWPADDWLILLEWMMPILNLKSPYGRAALAMTTGKPALHIEIAAHIDRHSKDGMQVGWQPTCADLLANDWTGTPVEYSKKGWKTLDEDYMSNFEADD